MSKIAKKKASEDRKKAKKAKRAANYARTGPKAGHTSRRQKRSKHKALKGQRHPHGPINSTPPGATARRRRRTASKHTRLGQHHANRPLRPLRQRRKEGCPPSKLGREVRGETKDLAMFDQAME
jgi:hypothetical protein